MHHMAARASDRRGIPLHALPLVNHGHPAVTRREIALPAGIPVDCTDAEGVAPRA
jgi:hypothetical protein